VTRARLPPRREGHHGPRQPAHAARPGSPQPPSSRAHRRMADGTGAPNARPMRGPPHPGAASPAPLHRPILTNARPRQPDFPASPLSRGTTRRQRPDSQCPNPDTRSAREHPARPTHQSRPPPTHPFSACLLVQEPSPVRGAPRGESRGYRSGPSGCQRLCDGFFSPVSGLPSCLKRPAIK
jgi:hypothetical protein